MQAPEYSRSLKTAVLASGRAMTSVVTLVSMAVLARVLSKYDYATYRQTLLVYLFISPLLMLGLPEALYYFIPREQGRSRSTLLESLLLLVSAACVLSLFLLLGGNRLLASWFGNPDLARTLTIIAPYSLCMFPICFVTPCLIARDRPVQAGVFNVLSRLAILSCVIVAGLAWRTPSAALIATVLGTAVVVLPAGWLMFRACEGRVSMPNSANMLAILKYSVPLGISGTMGTLTLTIDKIIVSSACDPEIFAVYANGAMEVPFVAMITVSAASVILPEMVQLTQRGEVGKSLELWRRAAAKCALIILPLMVFLYATAPQLMRLLFSATYSESSVPFRIYLLALPTRIVVFTVILMAAGKNNWVLLREFITLIVNIGLSIVLVRVMGANGAAIATVLTLCLVGVPYNLIAVCKVTPGARVMSILPFGHIGRVFLAAGVAILPVLLITSVMHFGDFTTMLLSAVAYGLVLSLGLYLLDLVNVVTLVKGVLSARR